MNAKQRREKWLWEHRPKEYMEKRAARRAKEAHLTAVMKLIKPEHTMQEKYDIFKANGLITDPMPHGLKEFLEENGVVL